MYTTCIYPVKAKLYLNLDNKQRLKVDLTAFNKTQEKNVKNIIQAIFVYKMHCFPLIETNIIA